MALGAGFNVLQNPFTTPKGSGPGPSTNPSGISSGFWGKPPAQLNPAYRQAMDFVNTMYGPQMQGFQTQADLITSQLGFLGASADAERAALQSSYSTGLSRNALGLEGIDLDRLGIGLKREGIGLDREGLGIAQEGLGLKEKGLGLKREGIFAKGKGLGIKEYELDALKSIAEQLYGVNTRDARQAAERANQGIRSDNTVRGSTNTPGYNRALGWVGADLANRLESLGLGNRADQERYNASKGQIGVERTGIDLENRNLDLEYGGLGLEGKDLDLSRRRLDISDKELDLVNSQLDLKAKGYNISGEELRNNLEKGLQKIGLDQYMNTNQLMQALNSNNMEQRAVADEMYRAALEYSDLFGVNSATPTRDAINTSITSSKNAAIDQFIGR